MSTRINKRIYTGLQHIRSLASIELDNGPEGSTWAEVLERNGETAQAAEALEWLDRLLAREEKKRGH